MYLTPLYNLEEKDTLVVVGVFVINSLLCNRQKGGHCGGRGTLEGHLYLVNVYEWLLFPS